MNATLLQFLFICDCPVLIYEKEWDAINGGEVATLTGHARRVNSVAWSGVRKKLASALEDGTVRIWDPLGDGEAETMLDVGSDVVETVVFFPDGSMVATGGDNSKVRIWDILVDELEDPILIVPVGRGDKKRIDDLDFSPGGTRIVLAVTIEFGSTMEYEIEVWRLFSVPPTVSPTLCERGRKEQPRPSSIDAVRSGGGNRATVTTTEKNYGGEEEEGGGGETTAVEV